MLPEPFSYVYFYRSVFSSSCEKSAEVAIQHQSVKGKIQIPVCSPRGLQQFTPPPAVYGRELARLKASSAISCSVVSDSAIPHGSQAPLEAHGILQVRILDCVVIPFSRGFFQPRDRTFSLQADPLPSEPPGTPQPQLSFRSSQSLESFLI